MELLTKIRTLGPSFNIRDLSMDSRNKIISMGKEYTNFSRYISAAFLKGTTGSIMTSQKPLVDPQKYYHDRKEFKSLIGDFNYVDLLTGLAISSYAWEFDSSSIPYILNSLVIVGPISHYDVNTHEKRLSSKNKNRDTNDLPFYGVFYGACVHWVMNGLLPMIKEISMKAV